MNLADFRERVPIRIYTHNGISMVDWIDIDDRGFREPFFEDSVHRLLRAPYNQLFRVQTPFDTLGTIYRDDVPRPTPTGFIFHISRCGSTLVSQMLAASERNVVLSEAPPIDRVLRTQDSDDDKLRWIVNAYAPSLDSGRRLFVKFDSWALAHFDAILAAYPAVPSIFLYREPIEVIVSLLRQPGYHAVPGMIDAATPQLTYGELISISREEYCARVIGRFCELGLRFAEHPNVKLINYSQLPGAVLTDIVPHFGFAPTDDEIPAMERSSQRSAKRPGEAFQPDSQAKQAEANEKVIQAADVWVRPFYDKLEALRIGRSET